MSKMKSFKAAAQGMALLGAAMSLSACETLEMDRAEMYTPAPHYERYPIKVAKQPVKLAISSKSGHVTPTQAAELAAAGRRAQGVVNGGMVSVRRPSGGGQSAKVATEVKSILINQGVPAGKIVESTYSGGSASPVQVTFVRAVAVTEECGAWNNLAYQPDNEPYDNFGCAHQHNIAAMVANPQDLVVPQPSTPPEPGKLSVAVDDYRGFNSSASASGGSSSDSGSSSSSSGSGGSSGGDSGGDSGGSTSSE